MTATRTTPPSRSPRTPCAKAADYLKATDGPPSAAGSSRSEKPGPQGALSPSLFDSLQQRANKLKVLLDTLQSSGGRHVPGGITDLSPQRPTATGSSFSSRDAGCAPFVPERLLPQQPASAPVKTGTGSKLDIAHHQRLPAVNCAAPNGATNRVRAGSLSSGNPGPEARPSWKRDTQVTSHGGPQSRTKDSVSSSLILREGATEKSRPSGGELGQGTSRPPLQRPAPPPAPAPQRLQDNNWDAAPPMRRRSSSDGGATGVPMPMPSAGDRRLLAHGPPNLRVQSTPAGDGRVGENVAADPHAATSTCAACRCPSLDGFEVIDATAAAAGGCGGPAAADRAHGGSAPRPVLLWPHPPIAPPSQQPSWSSSGGGVGPRRSSGGSGRRNSTGGGGYSDSGGDSLYEGPVHAPPLPPPPPLPARPGQARPSRSPSSSPHASSSRSCASAAAATIFMPTPLPPPPQHTLVAPPQLPPSLPQAHGSLPQDAPHTLGPPAGRVAALAAMAPHPPPQLQKGIADGGKCPPQLHARLLPPSQAPQGPPPRSQAAEELSAILSDLAAVAAPSSALPASILEGLSPPVDLDMDLHPDPDPLSGSAFGGGRCGTAGQRGSGDGRSCDDDAGGDVAAAAPAGTCTAHGSDGRGDEDPPLRCRSSRIEEFPPPPPPRADCAAAATTVTAGDGDAGGIAAVATAASEGALAQALAVARASAVAAFLRPEARVYRQLRDDFKTARSGVVVGGGGSPTAAADCGGSGSSGARGQVFAGVPASAAPFSCRDALGPRSPRCGYGSSGLESGLSPGRGRSTSARSSRYERLLMLQEAACNSARQRGSGGGGTSGDGGFVVGGAGSARGGGGGVGGSAGPPGPDFMRRNEVLLKKRQAWAAAKREADAKESDGSLGSPRNQPSQPRRRRASWGGAEEEPVEVAATVARHRRSSCGVQQRSLMDLQRWAERRQQRLAVLREEREAEERAHAEAQFTFKPAIGARSRRLAKMVRARPSYVPMGGCSPPPGVQTPAAKLAAATTNAKHTSDADLDDGTARPGSAVASNRPPRVPGGPMGRPPRASCVSGPRALRQSGGRRRSVGGGGSAAPAPTFSASQLSAPDTDLLTVLRGERPCHQAPTTGNSTKGSAAAYAAAATAGPGAGVVGTGAGGRSRGAKLKAPSAAAQLAAARNSRARGRYASTVPTGYEDPVVGSVADAIKRAKAALKLRSAPARRATLPSSQSLPQQAPDGGPARTRPKFPAAQHGQSLHQQPYPGAASGRAAATASRSSLAAPSAGLGPGGSRRRRASAGVAGGTAAGGDGGDGGRGGGASGGGGGGHEDPHNTHAAQQQRRGRQSAPFGRLDLRDSPQSHSPNAHTHTYGGSRRSSVLSSPLPGGSAGPPGRSSLLASPNSSSRRSSSSPAAAVIEGLSSSGTPDRTLGSTAASGAISGIARRTIDMLAPAAARDDGSGLSVRTCRSAVSPNSSVGCFGSDVSGLDPGASLRFSISTDGSPFAGCAGGIPVLLMLGPAAAATAAATGGSGTPAAAVAATAMAATMVGPSGTLARIPQMLRLASGSGAPQDGRGVPLNTLGVLPLSAGGGGGTMIAAPAAPGGLAVGAFRYSNLTPSPTSSYMTSPYDTSSAVLLSTSPPRLSALGTGGGGEGAAPFGGATGAAAGVVVTATIDAPAAAGGFAIDGKAAGHLNGHAQQPPQQRNLAVHSTSVTAAAAAANETSTGGPLASSGNSLPLPFSSVTAAAAAAGGLPRWAAPAASSAGAGVGATRPVASRSISQGGVLLPPLPRALATLTGHDATATVMTESNTLAAAAVADTGRAVRSIPGECPTGDVLSSRSAVSGGAATAALATAPLEWSSFNGALLQILSVGASAAATTAVATASPRAATSSAYSVATTSPLPMESSSPLPAGLLQGIRYTKILSKQFAASLLRSNSRSSSAVAAGLVAAAAAAGGDSGGVAPLSTSVSAPASRGVSGSDDGSGGGEESTSSWGSLCADRRRRSASAPARSFGWGRRFYGSYAAVTVVGAGRAAAASDGYPGLRFKAVSLRGPHRPQPLNDIGAAAATGRSGGGDGMPDAATPTSALTCGSYRVSEAASGIATGKTAAAAAAVTSAGAGAASGKSAAAAGEELRGCLPDAAAPKCTHGKATTTAAVAPAAASPAAINAASVDAAAARDPTAKHADKAGCGEGEVEPVATGRIEHDSGQGDPLTALQGLIWEMKHLTGDGDTGDCGSDSFHGTGGSHSSGSAGGSGSGGSSSAAGSALAVAEESVAVAGVESPTAAPPAAGADGCVPAAAVTAAVNAAAAAAAACKHVSVSASASAQEAAAAAAVLPPPANAGYAQGSSCSASLAEAISAPGFGASRSGHSGAGKLASAGGGAGDFGGGGGNVSQSGPLSLEVLVQRAEQLRAAVMGTGTGLPRGSSPLSTSSAGTWTGSASQRASSFSASGRCPSSAVAVSAFCSSAAAAVAAAAAAGVSPVQPRCGAADGGAQRSGLSGRASAKGCGGGGSRSASRFRSADVGAPEFVFPRLRSEVAASTTAATTAAIRPCQPARIGDSLTQVAAAPVEATAAPPLAQGRTALEDEVSPEISLAGGFDQMPGADRKPSRRAMTVALTRAAVEQLARASVQQPRYTVWSLADHLPAAIGDAAAAGRTGIAAGTSTGAATAAAEAISADPPQPAQLPWGHGASTPDTSGAGAPKRRTHNGCLSVLPSLPSSTRSNCPSLEPTPTAAAATAAASGPQPGPNAALVTGLLAQEGSENQLTGSESLATLQSLIRQVAHL